MLALRSIRSMRPDAVDLGELDVDGRRLSLGWSLCAAHP